MDEWRCGIGGGTHRSVPLCWGAPPPSAGMVPPDEFGDRVEENADVCIVDGEHFFVRCHLEIPIHGSDRPFAWSIWCSLSEASYRHFRELWDDPGRAGQTCFGWVCSGLPTYETSTLHLPADVVWHAPGHVPTVELHDGEHAIVGEQREGISWDRVRDIARHLISR